MTRPNTDHWTYETVREELDAKAKQLHRGTFRSRYPLSASELFVLVSDELSESERAVCLTVLRRDLRDRAEQAR